MEDAAAPGGGAAEARARSRQHDDDYATNYYIPLSEPETLWGRIDTRSLGDRASAARLRLYEARVSRSRYTRIPATRRLRQRLPRRATAAAAAVEREAASEPSFLYEPRTKATRAAYEALVGLVQEQLQLSGQPVSALGDAADELITALKNDKVRTNPDRRKEIEKLVGPVSNSMFDQLVSVVMLTSHREVGVHQ